MMNGTTLSIVEFTIIQYVSHGMNVMWMKRKPQMNITHATYFSEALKVQLPAKTTNKCLTMLLVIIDLLLYVL